MSLRTPPPLGHLSRAFPALVLGVVLLGTACPGDDGEDGGTEPEPTADAGEPEPVADAGPEEFCPTHLRFNSLSGGIAHVGWSGFTHNVAAADGASFVAEVVQCDADCRNCRFEGPVFDQEFNRLRCESDTRIPCDEETVCPEYACLPLVPGNPAFTLCNNTLAPCSSAIDCDPGVCKAFWGGNSASEITVSAFGLSFQATDSDAPVNGNIDLVTGQVTFNRFGFSVTSSSAAIGGLPPVCLGDDVRADGIQNGICSDNPHEAAAAAGSGQASVQTVSQYLGEPCDAHSGSPLPARAGIYSLDCSTPLSSTVGFDMTTFGNGTAVQAVWTLDPDEQPACQDGPCWCGVCDNTTMPCHSADDCLGVPCVADIRIGKDPSNPDAGTPVGVEPRNNFCVDACTWDNDTFRGDCLRPVGVDAEGMPILRRLPCLPRGDEATIIATGRSERLSDRSFSIQTGVLGCAAAAGNPATNSAIGLPGPNVGLYKFRVDLE